MKQCLRMCVTCHARKNKSELLRFVVINDKITHDTTQKYNARGFYLCNDLMCINKVAKNKTLIKKLKRNITQEEIEEMISSIK